MRNSVLIAVGVIVSAISLKGQVPTGSKLVADVPFGFHQGDKAMPAGRYEVSGHVSSVRISNRAAKVSAVSVFRGRVVGSPSSKGYLGFRCYGANNTCFLREIVTPGTPMAIEIGMGKVEKEHARSSGAPRIAVVETLRGAAGGAAE